jgi:Na+/melibiose symporter-like transporter
VARLFIGAGSAFAFISTMKIVTLWFPPQWFGVLAGWTLCFGTLGAVFGESPFALALQWMPWRELMCWVGVFGCGLAVLAWMVVRDDNSAQQQMSQATEIPPDVNVLACLREVCRSRRNWIIALYAFCTTAPTDALGGMWGIPYLVHVHGLEEASAATAVSMSFMGLAVGSPLIGTCSTWLQSRRLPMGIAAAGATLSLCWLIYAPSLTAFQAGLLFFLFGFFGVYVMCFVAARDTNEPAYVGTMVGFVNMAAMLGSTLMMYFVGVVLDWVHQDTGAPLLVYSAHDYHIGLSIFPLSYAVCVFILIPMMRESYPKAPSTVPAV